MEEVFYMMGKLDSRYGIYYVYGNHDRQEDREQRGFTDQEFQIDDCELIVSSGASVGVFPIRTEKHCEYVVIELKKISASN